MAKKLFVGGLAWATDENGLRGAFERFGQLEDVVVVTDRDSGRSRGFGFVTFATSTAAEAAIKEMNGVELDGRNIRVNRAEEPRFR
jgi:RNA recognition motif-containing protein